MPDSQSVPSVLDRLVLGGSEGALALRQLAKVATSEGLRESEFLQVFDMLFDANLASSHKTDVITECLVPRSDYLIPSTVLVRIISAIGTPEIYYKNGKQHKLKRLSVACQQKLLEWQLCALHLFGDDGLKTLLKNIPLLFGLLSYEFLRPYVAALIVIALSNSPKKPRPWHVQLAVDLAEKFPFDPAIKALLAFFHKSTLSIHLKSAPLLLQAGAEVLRYPSLDIVEVLHTLPRDPESLITKEVLEVEKKIRKLFDSYATTKRRKVAVSGADYDSLEAGSNQVSIITIDSLKALATQLECIEMTNPSSVLSGAVTSNEGLRKLYLALQLLVAAPEEQNVKKLLYAVQYHVLVKQASAPVFALLLSFAQYGGLLRLQKPMIEFMNRDEDNMLARQILLFKCIDIKSANELIPVILSRLLKIKDRRLSLAASFFCEMAAVYQRWLRGSHEVDLVLSVPLIFGFSQSQWLDMHMHAKVSFLGLLRALKQIPVGELGPEVDATCLIPKPTLMYNLVVSTNPLIMSEALGYIVFLKSIQLRDDQKSTLALRNSYVMDAINFVWRDMAFKSEPESFNKGMLLQPSFLQDLGAVNYFSYSDLVLLKTVGGLIHNPSLSYLCAEIVWMLEDQQENISSRHPGPISEKSLAQFRQDPDVNWLPMTYFDIKVSLLNNLDNLGFTGLCDLLYSSLKPLASLRNRS